MDEPPSPVAATQSATASNPPKNDVFSKFDLQGTVILAGGVGALLWGLTAALGTGWGFWPYTAGLTGVTWAFFLALAVVLLAAYLGWRARRAITPPPRTKRWAGMLAALIYSGWVGTFLFAALTVPAIHDISTDLADPPTFRTLILRADNLDAVPGMEDADMKGLSPQQRWALIHQQEYGDIRSVRLDEPVGSVIARAERLAEARGWEIAMSSPEEGRLEATETTALFRFKDDIVLRVKPTDTGEGSIVDMRSVSRVGTSDLGVNAQRVRSFLTDLSGTVSAVPQ